MSVQSRAVDGRCPRRSDPRSSPPGRSDGVGPAIGPAIGPPCVACSSIGTAFGGGRAVGVASATVERAQVEVAAPPVQLGEVAGEQPEIRGHTEPDCPLPELDRVEQVQREHLSQHRRRRMSQQCLRGGVVERDAAMQVGAHECWRRGRPHDLAEQSRGAKRGRDVDPAEDDVARSVAVSCAKAMDQSTRRRSPERQITVDSKPSAGPSGPAMAARIVSWSSCSSRFSHERPSSSWSRVAAQRL